MYFKQAKDGENEWWMYLVTTFLVGLGYFMGQMPLYYTQLSAIENNPAIGTAELDEFNARMDFSILGIDSNLGLLLLFTIFIVATVFFVFAIRFVHHKSLKGLITHRSKINWPKIFFGLVVWLVLLSVFELISYFAMPEVYTLNVQWGKIFWLMLICLLILPIQTTLEELFFRSYIMKGLGLIASHKWVPLLITSMLFGVVHGTNPEIAKYGIVPMQIYYVGAGLLLGIMTIMDDGLELAIGVHAATNIYGALFMSYEGSVLQTDSIWRMSEVNAWLMAGIFLISGVLFLLLSKKMFDWGPWSKCWEEIDHNENIMSANIIKD